MLLKAAFATAFIVIAAACDKSAGDIASIETGAWYDTSFNGGRYFVKLDELSVEDRSASGCCYEDNGSGVAQPQDFTAKLSRNKVVLECGGETRKFRTAQLSWKRYEAPQFKKADTSLFRAPFCEVKVTKDIKYGRAEGYWTSLKGVEAEVSKAFTEGYIKSFKRRKLDLELDLYKPVGLDGKRPLILFIHGGAFYVGDKQEPAYVDFCNYFASMGYVTASMNYRMGFHLGKGEIERAGYTALQDAHAAIRFLLNHAKEYGIDRENIFIAGSSAGSITALNLAFMTEDDRPGSSHGGRGLFNGNDLGSISGSGNDLKADFKVKAVANMWGAVSSTDILENSRTDIISFHGDADNVVPYEEGYPFSSAGENISRMLSEKMYGSVCIDGKARSLGLRSEMHTFHGEGHALNTTGKEKTPNRNHKFIKRKIMHFFFDELVPQKAAISQDGNGYYSVQGNVESASWQVTGGFVTAAEGNKVTVLWRKDAPEHRLTASGCYSGGIGYIVTRNF